MASSQAGAAPRSAEPVPEPPRQLTERDRRILAFERKFWAHAGTKERDIREEFGLSATRYYQLLNRLLDSRAALEADPMLVKRLRRLRAIRQRNRSAKRLGIEKT